MKSFFKKLAFVMALAMVVSMVAPAAQTAVAAEEKKPLAIAYQEGAVITALNLAKVGAEEDLRFVYAPTNWKDLEVKWSSSNENVVSVNQNGVVKAEAAGTATISVAVGTETASIEVYSVDMTTFVATMGNAEDRAKTELTLKVDEEFDFAFYGIKDYSVDRYNCEWWAVDPEGVIELNTDNGLVKAVKPGTAKLTLAVMNLVTMQKTDVAACVITVEAEKPAVDPNNFEVTKMISDSKFELTFENKDITAEAIKAGLKVDYYATGDVRVNYNSVKSVSVKDGVATVEFYYTVGDGVKYVFALNGIEKEFTTYIGKPATMKVTWKDSTTNTANVAWAGFTTAFNAVIYNDRGTDITASVLNPATGKVVEYTLVDAPATANYWLNGAGVYFAQPFETAVVKATFWDGYDTMGVRVKAAESAATPITSTEKPLYDFPYQTPVAATVHGSFNNDVNTKIAAGDDTVKNFHEGIDGKDYIWLKLKDSNGQTKEVKGGLVEDVDANLYLTSEDRQMGIVTGQFSFMSDNMNIFTVSMNGEVKVNAAGNANILVYYDPNVNNYTTADKHLVAVVPVTCYAKRYIANVAIDKNYDTVSAYSGVNNEGFNTVTFKVTLTDQLGDKIDLGANDSLVWTRTSIATSNEPTTTPAGNNGVIASTGTKGEYSVTFTYTDGNLQPGASTLLSYAVKFNTVARQTFSVNVVNPSRSGSIDASGYILNFTKTNGKNDISTKASTYTAFDFTTSLIKMRNGVKYEQLPILGLVSDYSGANVANATLHGHYVQILKDGVDVTAKDGKTGIVGKNAVTTLVGQKITTPGGYTVFDKNLGAGLYTVRVYEAVTYSTGVNTVASPTALSLVSQNTLEIKDTQPAVEYCNKVKHVVTAGTAVDMAKAAFEVKIDGKEYKYDSDPTKSWKGAPVEVNAVQINANTFFYYTITVYVETSTTGVYVPYTITVNDYVSHN